VAILSRMSAIAVTRRSQSWTMTRLTVWDIACSSFHGDGGGYLPTRAARRAEVMVIPIRIEGAGTSWAKALRARAAVRVSRRSERVPCSPDQPARIAGPVLDAGVHRLSEANRLYTRGRSTPCARANARSCVSGGWNAEPRRGERLSEKDKGGHSDSDRWLSAEALHVRPAEGGQ
jgi:hypothetical protein